MVAPCTGRNPVRLWHCWTFCFMSSQLQVVCTTSSLDPTQILPWQSLMYHPQISLLFNVIILVICKLQSLRGRLSKAWRAYGALFSSNPRKLRSLYLSKSRICYLQLCLKKRYREMVCQEPSFTLPSFILTSGNMEIISLCPLFCKVFAKESWFLGLVK